MFYDILERKNAFLGYKNNKFKSFLGIIGPENVFYDILEGGNAFLGSKNSKLKKWKNWDFCKGVNTWFLSKIGHFSMFLFLSILGEEKVFYDILER